MFGDAIFARRNQTTIKHFGIDIDALKSKVSNLILQKPACNVDFRRAVTRSDAQALNVFSHSRPANAAHVSAEQFDAVGEAERLKHRNQMFMSPIHCDLRQIVDVLNVRKMFQLAATTIAVAGHTTDAGPQVVATRSERWDQRRRNE